MSKRLLMIFLALVLGSFVLTGCGEDGADGAAGAAGQDADSSALALEQKLATVSGESCGVCHDGSAALDGDAHQAIYDELGTTGGYSVNVLTATAVDTVADAATVYDTVTVTFTVLKDAAVVTEDLVADLGFAPNVSANVIGGTGYGTTLTKTGFDAGTGVYTFQATTASFTTSDFFVQIHLRKDLSNTADKPAGYFNWYKTTVAGGYATAGVQTANTPLASAEGCVNCHGNNEGRYLKHGNIDAEAISGEDFLACKVCHNANAGGHEDWQLLKDDHDRYSALSVAYNGAVRANMTTDELTKYAYTRSLANDVHMSHNMEFAYPQSMKNCATCHTTQAQRDEILSETYFTFETCRSCHGVDGVNETIKSAYPTHITVTDGTNCVACHAGYNTFATVHNNGFDPVTFAADGTRYTDAIVVSIDSAVYDATANTLTIGVSATSSIAGADAADIVPNIMVGAYGYNTKDFIVPAYPRLGYYKFGTANEFFTGTKEDNATAAWTVVYDLSAFEEGSSYVEGSVKRVEIAVTSTLAVDGINVTVEAPSKTFNLADNTFEAYFTEIVDVDKCRTCHVEISFHQSYGINATSNPVACRMCHTPNSGASHLEFQSRSFDSYMHAIHTFQPFDIDDVDYDNDTEAVEVAHHLNSTFPMFSTTNCLACHNAGTFNVPDATKSLPGKIAGSYSSDTLYANGYDRNIGDVAATVTGPAARACGSCHKSEAINADEAGELASLNAHFKSNGYSVEDEETILQLIINKLFN